MIINSKKLTKTQKEEAVHKLFEDSAPCYDFYLMLILSGMIITFGLLLNNIPVIIGGMMVAPILSPILSMSMGIIVSDFKLMKRSAQVIFNSVVLIVVISFFSSLLAVSRDLNQEIVSRAFPNFYYLLIAIFSGVAVSYAIVRPQMSETLPGVAVTVALIPPLASVGIALSLLEWNVVIGSLGLFVINLAGIIFASIIVFALLNFYEVKKAIEKKINSEEKVISKTLEQREAENLKELSKKVNQAKKIIDKKKKRL